jgi:hypothetical protein
VILQWTRNAEGRSIWLPEWELYDKTDVGASKFGRRVGYLVETGEGWSAHKIWPGAVIPIDKFVSQTFPTLEEAKAHLVASVRLETTN